MINVTPKSLLAAPDEDRIAGTQFLVLAELCTCATLGEASPDLLVFCDKLSCRADDVETPPAAVFQAGADKRGGGKP